MDYRSPLTPFKPCQQDVLFKKLPVSNREVWDKITQSENSNSFYGIGLLKRIALKFNKAKNHPLHYSFHVKTKVNCRVALASLELFFNTLLNIPVYLSQTRRATVVTSLGTLLISISNRQVHRRIDVFLLKK